MCSLIRQINGFETSLVPPEEDHRSWPPIYITSNASDIQNSPSASFDTFLISPRFQNKPKTFLSNRALYVNAALSCVYLWLSCDFEIPSKKVLSHELPLMHRESYTHERAWCAHAHKETYTQNTSREWAVSPSLLCPRTPSSLPPPPSFYGTESSFKPTVSCVTPWRVHTRPHKFYIRGRYNRHPEKLTVVSLDSWQISAKVSPGCKGTIINRISWRTVAKKSKSIVEHAFKRVEPRGVVDSKERQSLFGG